VRGLLEDVRRELRASEPPPALRVQRPAVPVSPVRHEVHPGAPAEEAHRAPLLWLLRTAVCGHEGESRSSAEVQAQRR